MYHYSSYCLPSSCFCISYEAFSFDLAGHGTPFSGSPCSACHKLHKLGVWGSSQEGLLTTVQLLASVWLQLRGTCCLSALPLMFKYKSGDVQDPPFALWCLSSYIYKYHADSWLWSMSQERLRLVSNKPNTWSVTWSARAVEAFIRSVKHVFMLITPIIIQNPRVEWEKTQWFYSRLSSFQEDSLGQCTVYATVFL